MTGIRRLRSRSASLSRSRRDHRREGWAIRTRLPVYDIGELTITRSRANESSARRSAFVGEWTPPSMYCTPSIFTGRKNPGIAQDAATASASRGRLSRPKTSSTPSERRTAQTHSGLAGQPCGCSNAMASAMNSLPTCPSGSNPASNAEGRAAKGRAAARANVAASSPAEGRPGRVPRNGGGRIGGPTTDISRAPAGESGRPSERANRSGADRPARSDAPAMLPADVPTITPAVRGSQPVTSYSAERAPAWNAPPATPPAPSTRPMRAPSRGRAVSVAGVSRMPANLLTQRALGEAAPVSARRCAARTARLLATRVTVCVGREVAPIDGGRTPPNGAGRWIAANRLRRRGYAQRYRPVKDAGRRSRNAATPSRWSSLVKHRASAEVCAAMWAGRSRPKPS